MSDSFPDDLAAINAKLPSMVPQDTLNTIMSQIKAICDTNISSRVPQINSFLPDFSLPAINQDNSLISIDQLLKSNEYVLITFYRGHWCPYCNLLLRHLQKNASELASLKCAVVAISPQYEDSMKESSNQMDLSSIYVCVDKGMAYAKQVGAVFDFTPALKSAYQDLKIDLQSHNGCWSLPISAAWLVDSQRQIQWAYTDADWTKRPDPKEVINVLKGLK